MRISFLNGLLSGKFHFLNFERKVQMAFEVIGKLVKVFDTAQVTQTFRKREFVIEFAENPQYPELIKFQLIQDKCETLDNFQVGSDIKVSFNLKGRKWTDPQGVDKYFNSLQAWRIDAVTAAPAAGIAPESGNNLEEPSWLSEGDEDDLPF
jgi:hypothetical protein